MLGRGAIAACVGLALLASGCNTLDGTYLREGVGTTVTTADIVDATNLQELYFGEVCRQAGLTTTRVEDGTFRCAIMVSSNDWTTFVQAGMNDIDRRCDAYLAWLDDRRRWREPILKQLHSTAAVTAAVLGLTGVGATPIAIVGAAFGFAQESFTNLSGRLITEVNHSTVQSIVMNRQNDYRMGLKKLGDRPITNMPAALYALRSYLRLCMPMTIETEINVTITGVERNGFAPPPLIRVDTVKSTVLGGSDEQIGPRKFGPKETIVKGFVARVQAALCEPADGVIGTSTRDAIIGYLQAQRATKMPSVIDPTSNLLRPKMQEVIDDVGDCKGLGFLNVFEVGRYGVPADEREDRIKTLQGKMTAMLKEQKKTFDFGSKTGLTEVKQTGEFDGQTRAAIGALRGDKTRTHLDFGLNRQIQAF